MTHAASDSLLVSVIVPVFNRSDELRRLLASLTEQTIPADEFEILICDDGSTENIGAVVDAFRGAGLPQIQYLRQQNLGPGVARNLGLNNASGSIVAFTDSDCIPDPNWLGELIRPIERSFVSMTGGLIDFRTADHLSGRCVNFLMSSMLGGGGARDPRSIVHMAYYPRAGNLAVLRAVAIAAGGFPGQTHGEDVEFSDRILKQGVRVEFVPTAIAVHNEKRSVSQVWREAFRKGAARIRLARERGVHEWIHTLPALLVLGLSASALTSLAFPSAAAFTAIPLSAYLCVLVLLSLQAGFVLREIRAVLLTPVYAALMHIGYGCGYLRAFVRGGQQRHADDRRLVTDQNQFVELGEEDESRSDSEWLAEQVP